MRSALVTPVCLGAGSTAVIELNLLPPSTVLSVLPSADFEAPSDDSADLFDISSDAKQ